MNLQSKEIFNSLSIGIIILDIDFNIFFTNQWVLQRFHSSVPLEVGTPIWAIAKSDERFLHALNSARDQGRSALISCKLNKLPFSLIYGGIDLNFNLVVSRVEDDKEGFQILVQIIDVTQIKHREEFLKDKQKELDSSRAKSFNHQRLVSLGELSTSIAHEINNPLAILHMNNRILEKTLNSAKVMSPKIQGIIDEEKDTINRINSLIVSIKNLARNGEGEKFTKVTLKTVLEDVLPVLQISLKSKNIEIRYDLALESFNMPIECMHSLFGQVFINLFNNAIYAIKNLDEKWIEVEARSNGEMMEISVTDSGKGIPPEISEKIFIPFYTTKDIGEGTGLGLSTVLKIVESHSGKIYLDCDSRHTKFVILIPIVRNFV